MSPEGAVCKHKHEHGAQMKELTPPSCGPVIGTHSGGFVRAHTMYKVFTPVSDRLCLSLSVSLCCVIKGLSKQAALNPPSPPYLARSLKLQSGQLLSLSQRSCTLLTTQACYEDNVYTENLQFKY